MRCYCIEKLRFSNQPSDLTITLQDAIAISDRLALPKWRAPASRPLCAASCAKHTVPNPNHTISQLSSCRHSASHGMHGGGMPLPWPQPVPPRCRLVINLELVEHQSMSHLKFNYDYSSYPRRLERTDILMHRSWLWRSRGRWVRISLYVSQSRDYASRLTETPPMRRTNDSPSPTISPSPARPGSEESQRQRARRIGKTSTGDVGYASPIYHPPHRIDRHNHLPNLPQPTIRKSETRIRAPCRIRNSHGSQSKCPATNEDIVGRVRVAGYQAVCCGDEEVAEAGTV
jgi:hypothetical protein